MAYAEKRTYDKRARKWRYRGRYKLPNGDWGSVSKDDNGQPFYSKRAAEQYAHGLEVRRAPQAVHQPARRPHHGRAVG
jgi:hypothetical protein